MSYLGKPHPVLTVIGIITLIGTGLSFLTAGAAVLEIEKLAKKDKPSPTPSLPPSTK